MWPKRRGQDPVIVVSTGVKDGDILECIDANGIEMIEGCMGWRPVEGGKVRGKSCLKRIG